MSRVDLDSPVEVEKVGRYLKHIETYRRMERIVQRDGVSIEVHNGPQVFIKSHPLLTEMNKVNSSIINIEKTFKFIDEDGDSKSTVNDLI